MKRSFLFFLFIFYLSNSFSQDKRNNMWYFGEYAGLNFNTNPPTVLGNSAMTQLEGSATMSDANGQLLFYTNGVNVWNRNHQVMMNGTGLLGDQSSTQSALIIPDLSNAQRYYIFTVPIAYLYPFSYSIVDMTQDGGLGAITIKNVAIHVPMDEKLTATINADGNGYWIVVKEHGTDAILAYSFTAAGIDPNPVISHIGFSPVLTAELGYARISPNGRKLCILYEFSRLCQLFDFDNSTGIVSNQVDITEPYLGGTAFYGAEFSPDNSKLYLCDEGYSFRVRQYDLLAGSATAIQNSVIDIVHEAINQYGGAIGLGPDNKIYNVYFHRNFLSVINQPNLTGAACNYTSQNVVLAPGTRNGIGLSNMIRYITCVPGQAISNNVSICANQAYQLPSGLTVDASGTYLDTIRNQAGICDSIIYTINLSIATVSLLSSDVHICPNQNFQLPSGTIINTAGIYLDTIRNQASCDSIINTIHLFIDQVILQNTAVHICPGQVYMLPSGTVVNTAGIYIDTLRTVAGCDSIIKTVHLFVDQATLQNTAVHICPGQVYMLPSGTVVNTAGTYIDTLRSVAGCDSIIKTVQLFIDQASLQNTDAHICSNQTYMLPSGIIVNTSGIYIDTLRGQASCDSIINTIHLTVNDHSYSNHSDSISTGQTYTLPSGEVVSAAGTYQSVLINSLGCDSVITTTLKIKQSVAECITLKNAITPNGDGVNDYWVLYKFPCFKRLEVSVYNRYGSLVYYSDDYKNDWNGKYKNKELPDGTYYYIMKVFGFDGKEYVFKNNITILR